MVVCQLASSLFNISKKIARIRTKDFLEGKWNKLYTKSNIPLMLSFRLKRSSKIFFLEDWKRQGL